MRDRRSESRSTEQTVSRATPTRLRMLMARAALLLAVGFVVQHGIAMAFSYLTFEHALSYCGSATPRSWPAIPDGFWHVPIVRHLFLDLRIEYVDGTAYLGAGHQPGVCVETAWGGIGIWREQLPRRLHDSWGLAAPVAPLVNEEEPDVPAAGLRAWRGRP